MATGRHIALLRGINVGKAKRIAMADLRALVEKLGYGDVSTLLNSGNVVFTVPKTSKGLPGPRIEAALFERLGVKARVTVLTAAELAAAIDENPLLDVAKDHSRLLVSVWNSPADRKLFEALTKKSWKPDALALGKRVAYLWCVEGVLDSPLSIATARALGDGTTARNWTTMCKLHALASQAE